MRSRLVETTNTLGMGDVADFRNFVGAVIDRAAFKKLTGYVDEARRSDQAEIIAGGEADDSMGYFIRPTLIKVKRPDYRTMCEELFGPVVTLYVYPEKQWNEILRIVDSTSPYGLTGGVFATDRMAIADAHRVLRRAAGNCDVDENPTAAGGRQQPFG